MKSVIKEIFKPVLPFLFAVLCIAGINACNTANKTHPDNDNNVEEAEDRAEAVGNDVYSAGNEVTTATKKAASEVAAETGEASRELGNDTKEAARTASDKLEETKNEFVASIREESKKLDAKIDALKVKIDAETKEAKTDADAKSREAKAKMRRELGDLETQRAKLNVQLDKLQNSTESAWQSMKKGVRDAVDDLKSAADRVENEFDKEREHK